MNKRYILSVPNYVYSLINNYARKRTIGKCAKRSCFRHYLESVDRLGILSGLLVGLRQGERRSYIWNVFAQDFRPEQGAETCPFLPDRWEFNSGQSLLNDIRRQRSDILDAIGGSAGTKYKTLPLEQKKKVVRLVTENVRTLFGRFAKNFPPASNKIEQLKPTSNKVESPKAT